MDLRRWGFGVPKKAPVDAAAAKDDDVMMSTTSTTAGETETTERRPARARAPPPPAPPPDSASGTQKTAPEVFVYTDGACAHNGRPNARAGYGVYFGEGDPRNVSARVAGRPTNNVAELEGVLRALELVAEEEVRREEVRRDDAPVPAVTVVTDSTYAIRCATTYGAACAAKGWPAAVPNRALVRRVHERFRALAHVRLRHVRAHTGARDRHSVGNARADRLATAAIALSTSPRRRA